MTTILVTLGITTTLALAAGAFFGGLYLGERGRRKDLAWLVDRERKEPEPVTVRQSLDAEGEAIHNAMTIERERLIEDLMRETGCKREVAEAEADRIINQVERVGALVEDQAWLGG